MKNQRNVAVKWIALFIRDPCVHICALWSATQTEVFLGFPRPLEVITGIIPYLPTAASFRMLSNLLVICYSSIRRYIKWVCSLFNDSFQWSRRYSVEWTGDRWKMNGNDVEGRPNLSFYPGICLEGLRKTTKTLNQNSRSPADIWTRDLLNKKQDKLSC
jgi:hypothetical protein